MNDSDRVNDLVDVMVDVSWSLMIQSSLCLTSGWLTNVVVFMIRPGWWLAISGRWFFCCVLRKWSFLERNRQELSITGLSLCLVLNKIISGWVQVPRSMCSPQAHLGFRFLLSSGCGELHQRSLAVILSSNTFTPMNELLGSDSPVHRYCLSHWLLYDAVRQWELLNWTINSWFEC